MFGHEYTKHSIIILNRKNVILWCVDFFVTIVRELKDNINKNWKTEIFSWEVNVFPLEPSTKFWNRNKKISLCNSRVK